MNKSIGIYFDEHGGTRGGPYVRANLLAKYIPYVNVFTNINEAKNYDILDFQWRVPKELEKYKHICTFHGILPLRYCSNVHAKLAMWYRTQEQKRLMKTAREIITVSDEAKRQARTLVKKETHVVYAGIETDKYKVKKKKDDKIIFLNSLEKYENLQLILDALKDGGWTGYNYESLCQTPPFVVDAYGYGRLQEYYQKQIWNDDLPVNIKEEVENAVIIKALSDANCLIQPALQETFGLPICEAMASGAVVIASDITSHRENFDNVLFCHPQSPLKLAVLIEEVMKGKYNYLIKPALKEVKRKYNAKRFIEETKSIYEIL